ncbi:MAG: hypothetical protein ACM3KR_06285 [Deltaproteobacteria bacterium]
MNFGEILKTRRTFGKMSLNKLSDISGFDIKTLRDFENNNTKPVIYEDIPNGKIDDNNIGLFNEYLKFCRLTQALRFDINELESKIRSN